MYSELTQIQKMKKIFHYLQSTSTQNWALCLELNMSGGENLPSKWNKNILLMRGVLGVKKSLKDEKNGGIASLFCTSSMRGILKSNQNYSSKKKKISETQIGLVKTTMPWFFLQFLVFSTIKFHFAWFFIYIFRAFDIFCFGVPQSYYDSILVPQILII